MKALRVLVVEDDPMIGGLLAEMLELMGYEVCAVEVTEAAAVAGALRHRPDLMIVDVRLGEGNGVAAVAEILRTAFIPCVFVSGDISSVLVNDGKATLIRKPYREVDLTRAIHHVLTPPPGSPPPGTPTPGSVDLGSVALGAG